MSEAARKPVAYMLPHGSRAAILASIPHSIGGEPPSNALSWPCVDSADRVPKFVGELQALGVKTFVARNVGEARAYVLNVIARRGGDAVIADRAAVSSLQLQADRIHSFEEFPAEDAELSVTEADFALADTGSIGVMSAPGEGRTLSLVAPVNIVVVPSSRIVSHLPELFSRMPDLAARSSAVVLVTGPSRTADIELTLTVGVHGPGEVHAVILDDTQ